jgi:hypothetical protein
MNECLNHWICDGAKLQTTDDEKVKKKWGKCVVDARVRNCE